MTDLRAKVEAIEMTACAVMEEGAPPTGQCAESLLGKLVMELAEVVGEMLGPEEELHEHTDSERLEWLLEALRLADIDVTSLEKWMGQGEGESRRWPDHAWIDTWLDSREEPTDD